MAKPLRDQLWPDQKDGEAHLPRSIVASVAAVIAIATGLMATQAIGPSAQVTPSAAVAALKRATQDAEQTRTIAAAEADRIRIIGEG